MATDSEVLFTTHILLIAQTVSIIKRIKTVPERISIKIISKVFPGDSLLKSVKEQGNYYMKLLQYLIKSIIIVLWGDNIDT